MQTSTKITRRPDQDMTQTRYARVRTIGLWGGAKNILLAIGKITFGITGHSHALLADGIHSLSDVLIDGGVIIASKVGSKVPDEDHPYGHGRIETAATVGLAFLLVLAACGILLEAGFSLTANHVDIIPSSYVLWVALASITLNECLYHWTKWTARDIKSQLLMTHAWHHRSDSSSSLAVVMSILGSRYLGFPKLDALSAIIVGVMILKLAWDFGWNSLRELVDTGSSLEDTDRLERFIKTIPGVNALHQLRTRSVAGTIFCDVHVLVNPTLSVSEGHRIGQEVESSLAANFPDVADVTVHIDIEDDSVSNPTRLPPQRSTLLPLLRQAWQDWVPAAAIDTARLHYRGDKLTIELNLPTTFLTQNNLLEKIKTIMNSAEFIADIKIFYYKTDE